VFPDYVIRRFEETFCFAHQQSQKGSAIFLDKFGKYIGCVFHGTDKEYNNFGYGVSTFVNAELVVPFYISTPTVTLSEISSRESIGGRP
jgi:hypothetical protein